MSERSVTDFAPDGRIVALYPRHELDNFRCAAIHHRVNRRWRPCVHCRCCRSNRESVPTQAEVMHVYEIRTRKDKRGVDLISDALPFARLWYDGTDAVANAIGYAMHRS